MHSILTILPYQPAPLKQACAYAQGKLDLYVAGEQPAPSVTGGLEKS